MRILSVIGLVFGLTGSAYAHSTGSTFAYDLSMKGSTYNLKMAMIFDAKIVDFRTVTEALNDANLMNLVSKTIVEGWIDEVQGTSHDARFQWNLRLNNFGLKSHLITKCHAIYNQDMTDWRRRCDLDTKNADGNKSMVWKFDIIHCRDGKDTIRCDFDIQGQPKDMKLAGFRIVRGAKIAFEGKRQAIENFSKIFFYLVEMSTSVVESIRNYEASNLAKRLNADIDDGLKKYKEGDWSESLKFRAAVKYGPKF